MNREVTDAMAVTESAHWRVHDSTGLITAAGQGPAEGVGVRHLLGVGWLDLWTEEPELRGVVIAFDGTDHSRGPCGALAVSTGHEQAEVIATLLRSPVPTVGVLSGRPSPDTVAAALACHIRVCAEDALVQTPPASGGITDPRSWAGWKHTTAEILASSAVLSGSEAKDLGVVDHLVEPGEELPFATQLLHSLTADKPLHVVRAVTRALNNARLLPPATALEEEGKLFCQLALQAAEGQ